MLNRVLDQIVLLFTLHQPVEISRLLKVIISDIEAVTARLAMQLNSRIFSSNIVQLLLRTLGILRLRLIIGIAIKVLRERRRTIALVVANLDAVRLVDGELQIVGAETVAVRVRVREQTSLQHLVVRDIDTWNHVRGREGYLFNLGEKVGWVAVKDHLSDLLEWVILVGPDLGDIKDIPAILGCIFLLHHLEVHGPAGEIALGDGIEQVLDVAVRVGAIEMNGFIIRVIFDSLIGLEVPLHKVCNTLSIDEFQRVGRETIHVAERVRRAAVREQNSHLMQRLGREGEKVPEGIRILKVCLRVTLLGVNEIGKFERVTAVGHTEDE